MRPLKKTDISYKLNHHAMKKLITISVLSALFVGLFAACTGENLQGSIRNRSGNLDYSSMLSMEMQVEEDGTLTGEVNNLSGEHFKDVRVSLYDGEKRLAVEEEPKTLLAANETMTVHTAEPLDPGTKTIEFCFEVNEKRVKCADEEIAIYDFHFSGNITSEGLINGTLVNDSPSSVVGAKVALFANDKVLAVEDVVKTVVGAGENINVVTKESLLDGEYILKVCLVSQNENLRCKRKAVKVKRGGEINL